MIDNPWIASMVVGLMDGIADPCGISVLLFLISQLLLMSRKRILIASFLYSFVMFLTYLIFMCGLVSIPLNIINSIRGFLIVLFIIWGILEVKDFFFYKAVFSLEIPNSIKRYIFKFAQEATIPAIILAIVVSVLLKASFIGMIYSFIIVWWPIYARLFRAETLRVKAMDYIAAAQLYGVSPLRLFFRYLFINTIDPIIAYAMLDFGNVILGASILNFIGVGLQPGLPILGEMASDGVSWGFPKYWWWSIFPSITILIIALGFVLLGDRLQDIIGGRAAY